MITQSRSRLGSIRWRHIRCSAATLTQGQPLHRLQQPAHKQQHSRRRGHSFLPLFSSQLTLPQFHLQPGMSSFTTSVTVSTSVPLTGPSSSLDSSLAYLIKCCATIATPAHSNITSSLHGINACVLVDILTTKLPPLLFRIGQEREMLSSLQVQKLACLSRWWVLLLEQRKSLRSDVDSKLPPVMEVTLKQVQLCFHALYSLDSNCPHSRMLVSTFTTLLAQTHIDRHRQDTSMLLCSMVSSLRNMHSDFYEVREAVQSLAERLEAARVDTSSPPAVLDNLLFTSNDIVQLMYGLKSMSNSHPEVNYLVSEITHVLRDVCKKGIIALSGQEVGHAMYGLQDMTVKVPLSYSREEMGGKMEIGGACKKNSGGVSAADEGATERIAQYLVTQARSFVEKEGESHVMRVPLYIPSASRDKHMHDLFMLRGIRKRPEVRDVSAVVQLVEAFRDIVGIAPREFEEERVWGMNSRALGKACWGMRGMTGDGPVVRRLLVTLTTRIRGGDTEAINSSAIAVDQFSPEDILNIFQGLENLNESRSEVCKFIQALADRIDSNFYSLLSPAEVSTILYSMHNFSSESREVRNLLRVIHSKISAHDPRGGADRLPPHAMITNAGDSDMAIGSTSPYSAQQISDSFYGLRNMYSDHHEVRNLLEILSLKTFECPDTFSPNLISTCVYSMRNKSCDHVEVRRILGALLIKLSSCSETFSNSELAKCCYGLKNLKSEHIKVKKLLNWLTIQVEKSTTPLSLVELSDCLYGLQSMSSEHTTVRKLLRALVSNHYLQQHQLLHQSHFRKRDGKGHVLSKSLFGLQHMSNQHEEVREILKVLADSMRQLGESGYPVEPFSSKSVMHALYGMQGILYEGGGGDETKELLKGLAPRVEVGTDGLTSQQAGYAIYGLRQMTLIPPAHFARDTEDSDNINGESTTESVFSEDDHPELRALLRALASRLKSCGRVDSPKVVRRMLSGLNRMSAEYPEVRELLGVVVSKFPLPPPSFRISTAAEESSSAGGGRDINSSSMRMSARDISKSLYGLKNMKADSTEVQRTLQFLTWQVSACREDFQPVDVCDCVYGMKNLSSDYAEVRDLASVLAERVVSCPGSLRGVDIGRCLRGFRCLSTDHVEVRKLLRAMILKVDDSAADLDPHSVEIACMGLQGMCSSYQDVRSLLLILEGKISQRLSREPIRLQPKQVCNAMRGLQGMSSDYPEVRRMLGVLVELLEDSSKATARSSPDTASSHSQSNGGDANGRNNFFTPRDMANALKGLQSMSCAHSDVRDAIRAIALKLLDDEVLLEEFKRDSVTIGVALASLKRIQATTMRYSETMDFLPSLPSSFSIGAPNLLHNESYNPSPPLLSPSSLAPAFSSVIKSAPLTQGDRIPEADRFRTYYREAKLIIGLIHPYSVRDVNQGRAARGGGYRGDVYHHGAEGDDYDDENGDEFGSDCDSDGDDWT